MQLTLKVNMHNSLTGLTRNAAASVFKGHFFYLPNMTQSGVKHSADETEVVFLQGLAALTHPSDSSAVREIFTTLINTLINTMSVI